MSREAPRQVWLPGSGVWAALPAASPIDHKNQQSEGPSSSRGWPGERQREERQRRGRKRSRERLAGTPQDPDANQRAVEHGGNTSAAETVGSPAAAAAQPTAGLTGYALQQDKEDSDIEEVEAPPTCPICLVDVIELSDKAVVAPCMHEFCHSCIWRWLSNHKRFCPLCKARVSSVLYDIQPSGTYKERDVPPSPKVRSGSGSTAAADADAPLLQRLQDFLGVAGLVDPYEQQQQQVRLRRESGSGRVGYSSRERQAQHAQQPRGSSAAAAAGAAAGPRPYFWRLQQRLQAGAYRPGSGWGAAADGSGLADGPVSAEDYALLFRRQVYVNDLWAVPLSTHAPRISLGSGTPQERRLTEWIDRELRALLQTDDVTIIRGFVMGLLVAYGLEPFSAGELAGGTSAQAQQAQQAARQAAATARQRAAAMVAAAGGGTGAGGGAGSGSVEAGSAAMLSSSPVEALQPFLFENSEHFWHELHCFATAPPYTIATYDRTVQYRRRPAAQAAQPLAGGAAGAAAGAAGARLSRWDQRQPASRAQQAQQPSRLVQPARVVHHAPASSSRRELVMERDVEASRRPGCSSRNPSPPPAPGLPVAAAGAPSLPQQAQQQQAQHQQQQHAWQQLREQQQRRGEDGRRWSRSLSPARQHSQQQRSRSRDRRRLHRCSRERERSYSRGRSRGRHRSGMRSRRHSSQRSRSRQDQLRCVSPSQYIAGEEDGGDRWAME